MDLYRFIGDVPQLEAPVLITALDGWVDAGGAATAAAEHIASAGEVIATFDADQLFDYRARRPILEIVDGEPKTITWSELTARHVRAGSRDLVVLTGPEPDFRWRALSAAVLDFALRLGIIQAVTLGSLGLAVPHTRPTQLVATASRRELLRPEDQRAEGLLRVPAACVSVIEMTMRDHGIPTVGFFAQTPHYVSATYTASVLSLIERLGRHLDVAFSLGNLVEQAGEQRRALDQIVDQRPEIKEYVERLEATMQAGWDLPSADELAAEVERFLRDQPES